MIRVRAPKRKVTRVKSRIAVAGIPATETFGVLHTVDEDRTLVRTIIQLDVTNLATLGGAGYGLNIQRKPAGTQVVPSLGLSSSYDIDVSPEEIWEYQGTNPAIASTDGKSINTIFRDIKSMRKLKKGDTLELGMLAGAASTVSLSGVIVMFFKET